MRGFKERGMGKEIAWQGILFILFFLFFGHLFSIDLLYIVAKKTLDKELRWKFS